ncbi:LURP-one-related family protein [Herbivorax sp. ANBcel31]|uniref:LURP-one-related/scramblase family protein n=1 Tax=Herbivorax sp. ANBcel31 TaxID=3069754 RepID=UPI0027AF2F1A|nr:LURP-one-related family protein [Herbivorax sp. ANBcel31]MDQ2087641.1 LURP-one-related family protein [Herbivorax sp. ANBcel31]
MRYIVRQKVFSLRSSFTIKDEGQEDIYLVKGQLLSLGNKLRIFNMGEEELCYIEQQLFRFLPEYNIYIDGVLEASIKKKFALFKNDFEIAAKKGQYYIEGDVFAYEFNIYKEGFMVASVSKKFFSFGDTYGVEVDDDENQVFIMALVIIIDMVCHNNNKN